MKDKSQIELEQRVKMLEERVSFLEYCVKKITESLNNLLDKLLGRS